MSLRTDLALESEAQVNSGKDIKGIKKEVRYYPENGFEVTEIKISTKEASEKIGKPQGRYITIESKNGWLSNYSDCFEERAKCISKELERIEKMPERVLVAGLGNMSITPDSLGAKTVSSVFATRHIKRLARNIDTSELSDVTVIPTGVMAQTGMESQTVIKALCRETEPELVIVVDALACSELSHLGTTIQMCDTGISPGSGVENSRKEISQNTLGIPCIAIGVPTVTDCSVIAESAGGVINDIYKGMIVTPKTVDNLVIRTSLLISTAINHALHPSLTMEEIRSLTS